MNYYFIFASVITFIWFLVHCLVGGKEIIKPLLEITVLEEVQKKVLYYCWHLVSFLIFLNFAVYLYLGISSEENLPLAIVNLSSSFFFFIWGVLLAGFSKVTYLEMPQGWLFLPVFILGVLGLV